MDRRPGIFQVGTFTDDGDTVRIRGWGLSPCQDHCGCHYNPSSGQLALLTDDTAGTLGLITHRPGCDCCQPWTSDELAAVVRDLADIDSIPVTPAA